MGNSKYKVDILLAVYKPNIKWFAELLESLNNQDYENIELIVYDDCPKEYIDERIFEKYIKNFPYKIIKGEINKGSNKAFEYLTEIADGDYFAYCDQDDIWEKNKISKMIASAISNNAEMVCCDLSVIDENSKIVYETYKKVSKRHIYACGNDVYNVLLVRNFAFGCATLFKAETAKKALPFCKYFYHDHWLSLIASLNGYIAVVEESLIKYRIHSNNQTGVFRGINNKNDYFEKRIEVFYKRVEESFETLNRYSCIEKQLNELYSWAVARYEYFKYKKIKSALVIFKYRKFGKGVALFEVLMPIFSKVVFNKLIEIIKSGRL